MPYGIYLSAAGSLAAQARQDVIANNLANVDTVGFKRAFAVERERTTEALEWPRVDPSVRPVLDRIGGGLFVHEVAFDPTAGTVTQTENPLDLALGSDGWFSVSKGTEQRYTRAGNFQRSPDGFLVTADGKANLLDPDGARIQVPDGQLSIDANGIVRVNDAEVSRVHVVGTVDYKAYEPDGDNLYRFVGEGAPEPVAQPVVRQQYLERSNVNPIQEMVEMIRTFRAYESNQRMITLQDQSLGRAVNDVGRVG